MGSKEQYIEVAVPTPLRQTFSYLSPEGQILTNDHAGCRVQVPFGRRKLIGVIVAVSDTTRTAHDRLKRIETLLDATPLWSTPLWRCLLWACQYYQHAVGEVFATAMPAFLREGRVCESVQARQWRISDEGVQAIETLKRAPKQQAMLRFLNQENDWLAEASLREWGATKAQFDALLDKHWIESRLSKEAFQPIQAAEPGPQLNEQQQQAVDRINTDGSAGQVFLLNGITGSGKTEVYLHLIEKRIAEGKQVLVLVPEIGLTPQMVQGFQRRLGCRIALLHSGMNDRERYASWYAARLGQVDVVLGTRSAIFTDLPELDLIIVDEEHDMSFKQQEGFRYSARDLAIWRGREQHIPVVLGSATPSLESLYNARQGRYHELRLTQRAGGASLPKMQLLDIRSQPMYDGVSDKLIQHMRATLDKNQQVLLFLNRRGFAPTLMCHDCGWVARCRRCDSHMTFHQSDHKLRCHHCGAESHAEKHCPECNSEQLIHLGSGTQRIESALPEHFPDTEIVRIDRDTTRRKGSLQQALERVQNGQRQILIGTQMLAKGHHFPNVTLVALLDVDQGIYSAEFRAAERMAQLILQVAGRAGRSEQPGHVYLQTHHPEHPLLLRLLNEGYNSFAEALLTEREQLDFPPYSAMAIFRAEAARQHLALQVLEDIRQHMLQLKIGNIQIYGPLNAPMEKRAGRYRAQLILQASQRQELQVFLRQLMPQLEALKSARQVRWSLDVDPLDTY